MAKKKRGGKKKGTKDKRPKDIVNELIPVSVRVDYDEAEQVDAEPLDADFTVKKEYIDPVEFCKAVYNGDEEVLNRLGIMKPPTLGQRLDAARVAIPYTNEKKPQQIATQKHVHSWSDEMKEAEERLTKRVVLDNERQPETIN